MDKKIRIIFGVFIVFIIWSATFLQAYSIPGDWWGTVTINENTGNDGAIVEAYIDGNKVASATVGQYASGYYLIHVLGQTGEFIQFKVNGINAGELQEWAFGSHRLDLIIEISEQEENEDENGGGHTTEIDWDKLCEPNWECSGWTECADGTMTRKCQDTNNCDYSYNKPNEVTGCVISEKVLVEENKSNQIFVLLGIVTIFIFIIILIGLSKK